MAAKYDEDMEMQARVWLEAVVGEPLKNVSFNFINYATHAVLDRFLLSTTYMW